MKIIWCMFLEIWTATDIIFSHFGPFFALLPPNSLENQNFEKMKIMSIDTILLMCTINQNHMMYPFWHMECDRHKFFSFSAIFCPVTFLTAWKIKISKKWKTYPEISSFYTCAPKIMIRWCTVPEKWCATNRRKKWHIEVGAPPKKLSSACEEVTVGQLKCKQRGELARF